MSRDFINKTTHAGQHILWYDVITPVGTDSASNIDTCGRVASAKSVVVCNALARSISLLIDPVFCGTTVVSIVAGAIVAEDEWFMNIDNWLFDNDNLSFYLPQSSSSEPSSHSGFPLQ